MRAMYRRGCLLRIGSAALVWGLLLTGASLAQGQEADGARAQSHLEAGRAMLGAADFAGAVRELERAVALSPSPEGHHALARALRGLGRYGDAWRALERLPAAQRVRPEVARMERDLRGHLGSVELTVRPAGARVFLDARELGLSPLPGPVLVELGPHDFTVRAPGGMTVTRSVQVRGERPTRLTFELDAPSSSAAPASQNLPPTEAPGLGPAPFIVSSVLTGLSLGAYLGLAVKCHAKYDAVLAGEGDTADWEQGVALRRAAVAMGVVSAVGLAATGTLLFFTKFKTERRAPEETSLTGAVMPLENGALASLSGRF